MPFTAPLAHFLLRLLGWRVLDLPNRPAKAVVIGYPHTSNWDFPVGILAMAALRLNARWAGKHTLFRAPYGILMRWLGGIPIDRSAPQGLVEQLAGEFAHHAQFLLVLTPEGTRSHTPGWKSGFYRIAERAAVPIVLGVIDAQNRRIGLIGQIDVSGDAESDMSRIASCYQGCGGFRSELASPIQLL